MHPSSHFSDFFRPVTRRLTKNACYEEPMSIFFSFVLQAMVIHVFKKDIFFVFFYQIAKPRISWKLIASGEKTLLASFLKCWESVGVIRENIFMFFTEKEVKTLLGSILKFSDWDGSSLRKNQFRCPDRSFANHQDILLIHQKLGFSNLETELVHKL